MTLRFVDDQWRQEFEKLGLDSFDALWELEADTVEPGNVRRGGWSSMARMQGGSFAFYLKRQENHDFRDPASHYRSRPTVVREWRTAQEFAAIDLGVAPLVCLGTERSGSSRGLLVTRALDQHRDLPATLQDPELSVDARSRLFECLAVSVRRMHEQGYRHNCLYGQHIMLKPDAEALLGWDLRLIDLEKASRVRRTLRATIGDLSQLERHTDDMSGRDRYWFWDCYFRGLPLRVRRRLLTRLAKRTATRGVRQYLKDITNGKRPHTTAPVPSD